MSDGRRHNRRKGRKRHKGTVNKAARRRLIGERRIKGVEAPSIEFMRAKCMDKVRFGSTKTAKRAARDKGLYWYRCPICGDIHLTSSPQPGQDKSAA